MLTCSVPPFQGSTCLSVPVLGRCPRLSHYRPFGPESHNFKKPRKPLGLLRQESSGICSVRTILAWCGPQVAGFLNVWADVPSQFDDDQTTIYNLCENYRHE